MILELKRTGRSLGWDDGDSGQRRNTLERPQLGQHHLAWT